MVGAAQMPRSLSNVVLFALVIAWLQLTLPGWVSGSTYTNRCHQCSVQFNRTKGQSQSDYTLGSDTLLCITNYQAELDEMQKRPNVNYSCPSYTDRCAVRFREMPGNRYRFSRICMDKSMSSGIPVHSSQCAKFPYYDPRVPKAAPEYYGVDLMCWCKTRRDFCNNWAFDSVFFQYWGASNTLKPPRLAKPVVKAYREPDGSYTQESIAPSAATTTEIPDDQDVATITGGYTPGTVYMDLDLDRKTTKSTTTTSKSREGAVTAGPADSPITKSSSEKTIASVVTFAATCCTLLNLRYTQK